ncbi:ankyrin repeat domain-containing protein [Flexivirga sp.]|uniref:ankyrin repeat domain-containing protein n=1 Tax=Flexivirga sp. TaxID=1962927 RepID=UPI003F7F3DD9
MSDANPEAPAPYAAACADLVRSGDTKALLARLDDGMPVDLADPSGNTLLMLAAYHGQPAVVSALLERGADVNRLNHRGQSPLAGAVFKGEDTIVWLLLEAGADVDAGSPSAAATAEMFGRGDLLR